MSNDKLAKIIDDAFEGRDKIGPKTRGAVRKAVDSALDLLDAGKARVAEKQADGSWRVNQWLKKAVLLSFRLNDMSVIPGGPGKAVWWQAHLSAHSRCTLATVWPWSFLACVIWYLGLFILGYVFNQSTTILGALGLILTLLAVLTAFAHDIQRQINSHQVPSMSG